MVNDWYLYILSCGDGTFYTGIAVDVWKRLEAHRKGKGAKYTRGRAPLDLVYIEHCGTHSEALRREYAVKRLTKTDKIKLIQNADKSDIDILNNIHYSIVDAVSNE